MESDCSRCKRKRPIGEFVRSKTRCERCVEQTQTTGRWAKIKADPLKLAKWNEDKRKLRERKVVAKLSDPGLSKDQKVKILNKYKAKRAAHRRKLMVKPNYQEIVVDVPDDAFDSVSAPDGEAEQQSQCVSLWNDGKSMPAIAAHTGIHGVKVLRFLRSLLPKDIHDQIKKLKYQGLNTYEIARNLRVNREFVRHSLYGKSKRDCVQNPEA